METAEHKKDILCPDCGLYTLSTEAEIANNRCRQCNYRHRAVTELLISRGKEARPYIPIKDADKEEYDIFYNKYVEKEGIHNLSNSISTKSAYAPILLEVSKHKTQDMTLKEVTELAKDIMKSKNLNLSEITLQQYINKYINYKKQNYTAKTQEFINSTKDSKLVNKSNRKSESNNRYLYLQKIAAGKNLNEIWEVMTQEVPGAFSSKDMLRQYLKRKGIEYEPTPRNTWSRRPKTIIEESKPVVDVETVDNIVNNVYVNTKHTQTKLATDSPEYIERFKPIEDEVNKMASIKFKQLKCDVPFDLTTSDYINMLEMLIYLGENSSSIRGKRSTQHKVMTDYHADAVHEQENAIAVAGDTYLSDKLHILRNERRYYERDEENLLALESFLKSINISMAKAALSKLMWLKNNHDDFIFSPRVDVSLLEKYDWAKSLGNNSISDVNNDDNTQPTTVIRSARTAPSKRVFRATCYLSGGGHGAYKTWSSEDIYASTQDHATNIAKAFLRTIIQERPGTIYQNLRVFEVNR